MAKEMVIPSHFGKSNEARTTNPSPPYHQICSHAKESDKRKRRRKRRKKTGSTTSQDVGCGEDFTIYKDESSMEEEDNKESNKTKVKSADSVRAHGYFVLHAVCSACSFVVNGNFILFFWVNGNFIFYFLWVNMNFGRK
jgi:hypothetical protein